MPHALAGKSKRKSARIAGLSSMPATSRITKPSTQRRGAVTLLPAPFIKVLTPLPNKRLTDLVKGIIKSEQWRIATTTGSFQRWASGADETVATRLATASINKLSGPGAKLKLATELNQHRVDNSQLIWRTETGEIAGHVPAIKSDPADIKRSVTTEHGRRDKARGALVSSSFSHGEEARHVTATASTLKHMMSPGEELLAAKPTKPTFSNYTSIGDVQKLTERTKLAQTQQEVREHHKINFAEYLTARGRGKEVPAEYHAFVGKGHDPRAVRSAMVHDMESSHPSIKQNRATTSQADLTPTTAPDRFKRSLSPPRGRIR